MEGEESDHGDITVTRIFVGGLGGSVTTDDLRKTFSPLGTVKAVDIVRTNGRSFAYMDFRPSSDKSLAKLFSTYNGCIWKGGRLKLEKAKEHYLVRLQREWAADAEVASCEPNNDLDADKNKDFSEKPKEFLNPEKMQLRIFFPRLKKKLRLDMQVKSLPYSGTGKHKYSFQRIEVPSLPVHFCDCEEHCDPSETLKQKHISALEPQSDAVSREEFCMMSSVMNKLFERDDNVNAKAAFRGTSFSTEDHSNQSVDAVLSNESDPDQATDEDNIVINMVSGGYNKSSLMGNQGQGTISANQESRFSKRQASDSRPTQNKRNAQKMKNSGTSNSSDPIPSKEFDLLKADESYRDGFASTKPVKKSNSETHTKELECLTEAQPTMPKPGVQSTRGLSWVQKSSWRELVGETGNGSFSIAHVLSGIPSTKQELPKFSSPDATDSHENKHQSFMEQVRSESAVDSSQILGFGKEGVPKDTVTVPSDTYGMPLVKEDQILTGLDGETHTLENSSQIMEDSNNVLTEPPAKKSRRLPKKTSMGEAGIGESCTFMRSAVSEREWMKTKAALSGSLKKKNKEK